MKDQLAVKDTQITSLTKLTNNAQTLNLVDKDPKRIQAAHGDAETKPERSSSDKKKDDGDGTQKLSRLKIIGGSSSSIERNNFHYFIIL